MDFTTAKSIPALFAASIPAFPSSEKKKKKNKKRRRKRKNGEKEKIVFHFLIF